MNHAKKALSPGLKWIYFQAFGDGETEDLAIRPRIAVAELGGSSCLWRQGARDETRADLRIIGQMPGNDTNFYRACRRFRRHHLRNLSAHCPPFLTELCALHEPCAKCPDTVWTIEHAFNPFTLPCLHCVKRCAVAARTTWPASTAWYFPALRVSKPNSPACRLLEGRTSEDHAGAA